MWRYARRSSDRSRTMSPDLLSLTGKSRLPTLESPVRRWGMHDGRRDGGQGYEDDVGAIPQPATG
jgi:hypothetical protein